MLCFIIKDSWVLFHFYLTYAFYINQRGKKAGTLFSDRCVFFALRIFPFFFSKVASYGKPPMYSQILLSTLTSGSEESDHFIKDWPSVQLPKSRSLEYWQSSLDGFVFRVLLRPPEKCKFEFTRDITESRPTPQGQENIYPNKSPFLWKYFQDLRMYQQTFSPLTEFQVRRSTQSHDHVHGTPNYVMMLPCYYVMCFYYYVMCSFYYVIFLTEKHFARRYSGWFANTIPANRWIYPSPFDLLKYNT